MLLRQAVISKCDYVEIELDAADNVRPFPGCRRVISYTNLDETPADLADIYADIQTKRPDAIKLTCRADTPEEAWPLVQILAKPPVPTVVVGLGRLGAMLAILGRKIGAPWTSAALERGREAYPGQPTIRDLEDVYAYRDIGKPTRFYGVAGLGERAFLAAGLLNAGFRHLGVPHRSLPTQVGTLKTFRKIADAVRLQGVWLDEAHYEGLHEIAAADETSRPPVQAADCMAPVEGGWTATDLFGPAVVAAVERTLKLKTPDAAEPLKGRIAMLAGVGPLTRLTAAQFRDKGASLIFASKVRDAAHKMSQAFGGRQLAWEAIYSTTHDILVIGRDGGARPRPTRTRCRSTPATCGPA